MLVNRLWTAMLTREIVNVDTGTDSRIGILVNTGGQERLNATFPDTWQDDQEAGVANMYDVDTIDHRILTEQLTGRVDHVPGDRHGQLHAAQPVHVRRRSPKRPALVHGAAGWYRGLGQVGNA